MEKISRKSIILIAGAVVIVCCVAISLLGNGGGTNKEKLLLGDWYWEGDDRVSFTLYDDGSCKVRNDYGLGKWSVVNDDRLNVSTFYGETMTLKIVKIDKKSMVVREIGYDGRESEGTGTLWHTAEDAMRH